MVGWKSREYNRFWNATLTKGDHHVETAYTGASRETEGNQRSERPAETDSERDGRGTEECPQSAEPPQG